MQPFLIDVVTECCCLVVMHPSNRIPPHRVGAHLIVEEDEEARDVSVLPVESDCDVTIRAASTDALGYVVSGRERGDRH
jgi:hypothetical protein